MKTCRLFFLIAIASVVILAGSNAFAEKKTFAEQRFEEIDTDDDGKISKDEFLVNCGQRFDTLDGNKDGYVTEEEFQEEVAKARETFREKRRNR